MLQGWSAVGACAGLPESAGLITPGCQPVAMDAVGKLAAIRQVRAQRCARRPESPAALAAFLDPKFNVTPTIRLLSDLAVRSVVEPNRRDIVTCPPRTGKSDMLSVWTPVWALMMNPDLEVMVISHGDDLAEELSGKARAIIREHAEFLGFRLSTDKTALKRWRVEGRKGGMLAAGISSGIVGRGSNLLVLDDVVKGAADAESAANQRRVLNEYRGSLEPRLHPGGSTFVLMTRWSEQDLAGQLADLEPDVWRRTNIPAVSAVGVPDALGRPPGVAMVSALGFTPADFVRKRRSVGERVWNSQYMGVPKAPEGELIKQVWLDAWRMAAAPQGPVKTVVAVDPSDSGEGDAAGIVAVSLTAQGVSALIADRSAPMTSDQWAKTAVKLAVEVGASEIAVEAFAARETYTRVVREELRRAREVGELRRDIAVTDWPPKGSGRGTGDALARSSALLQALEVGSCRLAGEFPVFEAQATSWTGRAKDHQPDRLAALVVGHDVLVHSMGQAWEFAAPGDVSLGGDLTPAALVGGGGTVTSLESWMSQKVG